MEITKPNFLLSSTPTGPQQDDKNNIDLITELTASKCLCDLSANISLTRDLSAIWRLTVLQASFFDILCTTLISIIITDHNLNCASKWNPFLVLMTSFEVAIKIYQFLQIFPFHFKKTIQALLTVIHAFVSCIIWWAWRKLAICSCFTRCMLLFYRRQERKG